MPKPKNNHQKPTKEELEAKNKAILEEAEKLKDNTDDTEDEETPEAKELREKSEAEAKEKADVEAKAKADADSDDDDSSDDDSDDDTSDDDDTDDDSSDDDDSDEPPDDGQADPSKELYKKKFSDSSKENQKINAKNRVINKALVDADDVPETTEEEMQTKYGDDWEMFSDTEKEDKKEIEKSKKWREVVSKAKQQATKIEKWNDSVDEYVADPEVLNKNPELEGKTEEFAEFAKEEANNNVPFNILTGAFLHEHTKNKKPNKGKMFEKGKGGSNEKQKVKSGKIGLEEARKLRETDYDKWKQLLKDGKIESDV